MTIQEVLFSNEFLRPSKKRKLNPPWETSRDDAIFGALRALSERFQEPPKPVSVSQSPRPSGFEYHEIRKERGPQVADLLLDIARLCPHSHRRAVMGWATAEACQIPAAPGFDSGNALLVEDGKNLLDRIISLAIEQYGSKEAAEKAAQKRAEKKKEVSLRLSKFLLLLQHEKSAALTMQDLDAEFNAFMNKQIKSLNEEMRHFESCPIQDVEKAQWLRMTLYLARLTLLPSGLVNVGILEEVFSRLCPHEWSNWELACDLRRIIQMLTEDRSLVEQIQEIKAPTRDKANARTLIRAALGMHVRSPVENSHARLTALWALLSHLRQAKAGTCFATCWMIKLLFSQPGLVVGDFSSLLQDGDICRRILGQFRSLPFQNRMTREGLDLKVELGPDGMIKKVRPAWLSLEQEEEWHQLAPAVSLGKSVGVSSVLRYFGLEENHLREAISKVGAVTFDMDTLLKSIAGVYWEKAHRSLRSQKGESKEKYHEIARFVFGSQSMHPLHRVWEQCMANMVCYMNSSHCWPHWIHETMESAFLNHFSTKIDKSSLRSLLSWMYLPMVTRMRYLYNPYIDDIHCIGEKRYASKEHVFYGYELYDSGTPDGFVNNLDLYRDRKNKLSTWTTPKFYPSNPSKWSKIGSAKEFCEFIYRIAETVASEQNIGVEVLSAVREILENKEEAFTKYMVSHMFGKSQRTKQEKKWQKNPYTPETTPWRLRWGGDSWFVGLSYFNMDNFITSRTVMNGSPREVLAWHIRWMRNQSDNVKWAMQDPYWMTSEHCPGHAFLFMPGTASAQKALYSKLPVLEYIDKKIIEPGKEVATSTRCLSRGARDKLVDYLANNGWYRVDMDSDDLNRQELLTDESKKRFDALLRERQINFENVYESLCIARKELVGRRCPQWERRALSRLVHFHKENESIPDLIDFARNRRDTYAFSPKNQEKYRTQGKKLALKQLKICEFRDALLKLASDCRTGDTHAKDNKWVETFSEVLDSKLFSLLSQRAQKMLYESMFCAHDTNWSRQGINNIYFAFLVNPGSNRLSLATYVPDTGRLNFLSEADWFNNKGAWELPKSYVAIDPERKYNLKKIFGLNG